MPYGMIGGLEMVLLLAIILVVVGPKRLIAFGKKVKQLGEKFRRFQAKVGHGIHRLAGGFRSLAAYWSQRNHGDDHNDPP